MNKTYIAHHGIKGQKWGIRRFQNEDGSLTAQGEERYEKVTTPSQRQAASYGINGGRKSGQVGPAVPYTAAQRKRDEEVYGKGAAKRIAKKAENGEQISGARSAEAARAKKWAISAKVIRVGTSIAGGLLARNIAKQVVDQTDMDDWSKNLVTNGAAFAGSVLTGLGTQSAVMSVGGYRTDKDFK